MIKREIWIRVESPMERKNVQDFILSLAEEDLLGEIEVILYVEQARAKCKLSHIYDVSEGAIPVLKEKYGDGNVRLTETNLMDFSPVFNPNPDPLERIAGALESISRSLESIDQTLEDATEILMDCQVKNQYGSAIAVAGTIQQV